MTDEQRSQYEQKKQNVAQKAHDAKLKENVLLQECIEVLNKQAVVLSLTDQQEVLQRFNSALKTILCSPNVKDKKEVLSEITDISSEWIGKRVLIIWDEASLPIIVSDLSVVLENIDDVKAVAFDTWIASENVDRFIEFDHNNKIWKVVV